MILQNFAESFRHSMSHAGRVSFQNNAVIPSLHVQRIISAPLWMAEEKNAGNSGNDDPYLKHVCRSCQYVYDEEKGFKKRYPPG